MRFWGSGVLELGAPRFHGLHDSYRLYRLYGFGALESGVLELGALRFHGLYDSYRFYGLYGFGALESGAWGSQVSRFIRFIRFILFWAPGVVDYGLQGFTVYTIHTVYTVLGVRGLISWTTTEIHRLYIEVLNTYVYMYMKMYILARFRFCQPTSQFGAHPPLRFRARARVCYPASPSRVKGLLTQISQQASGLANPTSPFGFIPF